MNQSKKIKIHCLGGLTIIELLVVVAILLFVTAMAIPRLRVINKDRSIREAARVVGSAFSTAINRALVEEGAGVMVIRNSNIVDTQMPPVNFAGDRLFVMRKLPPYAGDNPPAIYGGGGNSGLIYYGTAGNNRLQANYPTLIRPAIPLPPGLPTKMVLRIAQPLEHSSNSVDVLANDPKALVRPGDHVRLKTSSVRYPISRVQKSPGSLFLFLTLELSTSPSLPPILPNYADDTTIDSYLLFRQPKKLQSSLVELPAGFMIDLRYSGPINQATGNPVLNSPNAVTGEDHARVYFDEQGTVERLCSDSVASGVQPFGMLYFFVTEYDPETAANIPGSPGSAIFNPSAMWVTVNPKTGSVNVAYNSPPPAGLTLADQIRTARGLASQGISANQ